MREIKFHWLHSPQNWPYAREVYIFSRRHQGRPKIGEGILIGYSDVIKTACVGAIYWRRIVYLEDRDFPLDEGSIYNPHHPAFLGWPYEAVNPMSVSKGEPSINISRISRAEAIRRVDLTTRSVMACTACSSLARLA